MYSGTGEHHGIVTPPPADAAGARRLARCGTEEMTQPCLVRLRVSSLWFEIRLSLEQSDQPRGCREAPAADPCLRDGHICTAAERAAHGHGAAGAQPKR